MSLARALTTRLQRTPRLRTSKISLPVELITATNPSAFSAPDISVLRATGYQPEYIETSTKSPTLRTSATPPLTLAGTPIVTTPDLDSPDLSGPPSPSFDEAPALTDDSSIGSSSPLRTRANSAASPPPSPSPSSTLTDPLLAVAPTLPRRAPSHSKREHERLARSRSVRSTIERPLSPAPLGTPLEHHICEETGSAASEYGGSAAAEPFQSEMSALDIIAIEFAKITAETEAVAVRKEMESDAEHMEAHGLGRFEAWEYLVEIESMQQTMLAA